MTGPVARVGELVWNVVVNGLAASMVVPRGLRWRLLVLMGLDLDRPRLGARCFFGSRSISIGRGTVLNHEVFVDGSAAVEIGRDCHIGMRVTIVTGSHEVGSSSRRGGRGRALPVVVGDGAWVGAGVLILPGVTIGPGCVVAAGAVVTSDCAPDTVYAGVPAKLVRPLDG